MPAAGPAGRGWGDPKGDRATPKGTGVSAKETPESICSSHVGSVKAVGGLNGHVSCNSMKLMEKPGVCSSLFAPRCAHAAPCSQPR